MGVAPRVGESLQRRERLRRIVVDHVRRDHLVDSHVQPRIHRLAADHDVIQARLERVVQIRMSEPDQDPRSSGSSGSNQAELPILLGRPLSRAVIQRRERQPDALRHVG
jgi:hypothetical protein